MGSYETLRGGGKEVSGEAIAKAQGHNGTSATCTCETCTKHRERTHIYGKPEAPEPELPTTFTFNGLAHMEVRDLVRFAFIMDTCGRRLPRYPNIRGVSERPTAADLVDALFNAAVKALGDSDSDVTIDVSGLNLNTRKEILSLFNRIHGEDIRFYEPMRSLIAEFERFVYPEGYEPEVYPSVQTLKQEQWDREHGMELK